MRYWNVDGIGLRYSHFNYLRHRNSNRMRYRDSHLLDNVNRNGISVFYGFGRNVVMFRTAINTMTTKFLTASASKIKTVPAASKFKAVTSAST